MMAIDATRFTRRPARGASKGNPRPLLALRAGRIVACLLAVGLASAAHAAPVSYGDLLINPEPEPQGNSGHGYTEYWVAVTNKSSDRAHRVTLNLPRDSYGRREDHIRDLSRTFDVGPGATVRVPLLQPVIPGLFGRGIRVTIDGREQDDPVPFDFRSGSSYTATYGGGMSYGAPTGSQPLVLLSPGVSDVFVRQAQMRFGGGVMMPGGAVPFGGGPAGGGAMPGGPGMGAAPMPPMRGPGAPPPPGVEPDEPAAAGFPPPGGEFGGGVPPGMMPGGVILGVVQFVHANAPPPLWSPNWLGYSRYDGVVVTGGELRTLPAPVQTALWQYAEAGGVLLVLGAGGKVPEGWKRRQGEYQGLTSYEAGFGVCLATDDADYGKWPADRWRVLSAEWTQTAAPFGHTRGVADANQMFPVVDNIGIPVLGLFILMIVFALTIGPANLFLLGRLKRRIWLLWTVPTISLVTCAAVFGYMMVVEGWQGHLRTEAVTVLDEPSRRAATVGFTGFYAPLTPGDGLRFSTETELTPQIHEDMRYGYRRGAGGSPCTLEWAGDQHLAKGWVKPRVPAFFMARKSESRLERVAISRGRDGKLSAVNQLGVDVPRLWYADEQGQVYAAGPVAAGTRAVLEPTGDRLEGRKAKTASRAIFTSDWARCFPSLLAAPKNYLGPRSYLAQLDDSPFLEDGLRDAKTRKCHSFVLGFPREGDDEN
jgi:hypothetical protein